ncbi:ATP-binding protein [Streptomyces sp. NPDC088261]|uniref:ATP-binding protein n=1 Tax=Streptomyces sp. NPDC088261 TaxID=3365851 RepID=UPI00380D338A
MPENESTTASAANGPVGGVSAGPVPVGGPATLSPVAASGRSPRLDAVPPGPARAFAAFSPYAVPQYSQCPPPPPDLGEPGPQNLRYGLTLPSAVATPAVAIEAAEAILDAHDAEDELIEPVLLLVGELVVYACRFTGAGEQIHLSLCGTEEALQVAVYDTHAAHRHRLMAAACDSLRVAALAAVPELVKAHHGTWGFGAGYQSGGGTCTWAALQPAS